MSESMFTSSACLCGEQLCVCLGFLVTVLFLSGSKIGFIIAGIVSLIVPLFGVKPKQKYDQLSFCIFLTSEIRANSEQS